MKYTVIAVGGKDDGKTVAEFTNEADAINYCYDHADDYPLGHAIFDGNGKMLENW